MKITIYRATVITAVVCWLLLLSWELSPKRSVLVIEVRRTGLAGTLVLINGWPYNQDAIINAVGSRLASVPAYTDELGTHPDIEVVITASPETEFGAFKQVLEACRESGIHRVSLTAGKYRAPLLLFESGDLRGGVSRIRMACIDPPRIKLLWVRKDLLKETDSFDGRLLLKVKDIIFKDISNGKQLSPDYQALARYLSTVSANFRPVKFYPHLTAEIDAHWNAPFGVVARCASIAEESGIHDCCLVNLPWKLSDMPSMLEALGSPEIVEKWEVYKKQVERIRGKRDSREQTRN